MLADNIYNQAADAALYEYLGEDEYTEAQVELVADLLTQAADSLSKGEYANAERYCEKASSYVLTDMSLDELDRWVEICADSIATFTNL